jgi:predicted PurR-regulated permease PerM
MTPNANLQLAARVALIASLALISIWLLWRFLPALAWGTVLAIATWPAREWLTKRGMTRPGAAVILVFAVIVLLAAPLVLFGVQLGKETIVLVRQMRDLRQTGMGTPDWVSHLPLVGDYLAAWWQSHLADADSASELWRQAESIGLMHWARGLGGELINRLVILAFTLLTLFFIYRDGDAIMDQGRTVANRVFGSSAQHLAEEAALAIRATVNGLVLVGLAEGFFLGVGYVAAGVPHPVLFGFATALLATIPFGAPLVLALACFALVAQSYVMSAVLLLLFGSILVFIADHFIRPALIGRSTRLPFLWILLGIFGGLETFGLVGLFVGPAVLAAVLAIWSESAKPAQTASGADR